MVTDPFNQTEIIWSKVMCHNSISLQTNGDNRVSTLFSIRITTDDFFSNPPPPTEDY